MPANQKRSAALGPTGLLFVTLFNSILGLSVLFPVLGPLGRELGLSELQVGSLSAAYSLMQFLVSPWWGRTSERVGRKRVLMLGIAGFCVSFLAFGVIAQFARSWGLGSMSVFSLLLGSRLLGGAFSSATLPTAQAYIADSTVRSERAAGMALIGAAFGLGVVFGPALGAAFSTISLVAPVYFSSSVALMNLLFVWRFLPESKRAASKRRPQSMGEVANATWPLLGVGFVLTLASVGMEQTIAFYYQDRLQLSAALTARTVGIALVAYGLVAVFAQGFLVRRYSLSPLRLLTLGLPISLVGYVSLVLARSFPSLTLALVAQGLGQGLVMPGVTAGLSLAVGDDDQGTVAGLNSSAQAFGRMLGPLAGAALYEARPEYPYILSASLIVLTFAALIFSSRLKKAVNGSPASVPPERAA